METTLPKVAVVATVKTPLHELKMFVHYYQNLGIDEIILFCDDPEDPVDPSEAFLDRLWWPCGSQ